MLGDAAHKVNLAVERFYGPKTEYALLVKQVHALVVELRSHKNVYKLATITSLNSILSNDTRWNSVYDMLERFLELAPILDNCEFCEETTLMIPETAERKKIGVLLKILAKCKVASKFLQSHDPNIVNMISVRNCFDDLITSFPDMAHHLGQNASIVHCPDFETGVLKVLKGQVKLTQGEKNALKHFEIGALSHSSAQVMRDDDESSLNETDAQKWVRMAEESKQTKRIQTSYRPLSHLCPSSIICESLFSDAKHIMTADRRNMDPSTLEMLLFLK